MRRKIAYCLILILMTAQFMAVDTTLAGNSTFLSIIKASPGNKVKLSPDIFRLPFFRGIEWKSILAKKPTETPIPPPVPTDTPSPPPIPTNTPTTPPVPTNTPIPPPIPTRTPTATASRIVISTSTSSPPVITPGTVRTFTLSPLSPTVTDAEVKDYTPTPIMSSPTITLVDTPQQFSPTSSQLANIPVTGNSTSVEPEKSTKSLSLTSILGILMIGVIALGGLVFGDLKFLGSSDSDDGDPGDD